MTRPTAAHVGQGLSHPIRIVMNRGLRGNVAKLITIDEALELMLDLTTAIARAFAIDLDHPSTTKETANGSETETRPRHD